MSNLSLHSKIKLNNGVHMPILGLGTFNALTGIPDTVKAIIHAISVTKILLIDTSQQYGNEIDIGRAIKLSGVSREDLFVVSKLNDTKNGAIGAIEAIENSLHVMELDYIDQYLINYPQGGKIIECYDVLLEYQKKGLIKSVGVSNFGVTHLEALKLSGRPLPQVNQIELHPWSTHNAIVKWCNLNNVVLVACCPLTRGNQLNHPLVIDMAIKYDRTPAQILIRWSLQKGYVTIPKSTNIFRIEENTDVFDFELAPEDMVKFEKLGHCQRRYSYSIDFTETALKDFGEDIFYI